MPKKGYTKICLIQCTFVFLKVDILSVSYLDIHTQLSRLNIKHTWQVVWSAL